MLKRTVFCILALMLILCICSCGTPETPEVGCGAHIDLDDDGTCDSCFVPYTDGCDNHIDTDDNGKCDICTTDYTDACDNHIDTDDNKRCDNCAIYYDDGCDWHVDANDNQKCDKCGDAFDDGCDGHIDADDDEKCDKCNTDFYDGDENPLDGKKVIFVGNSYTYYGQTVLEKDQTYLSQSSRSRDRGYFYQLCKSLGADVEVTNWTFGGHSLHHLFGGSCYAGRGCDGEDHKAYLLDKSFDYVVIQPGSGQTSSDRSFTDIQYVMDFFKEANPDVKFIVLVPYSAYGVYGSTPTLAVKFLNSLKTLADMGVTVVDWGGVVMDIIEGRVTVPDSTIDYVKNTFVVNKSAKDGYHPNQLSGYITTLMTYCAMTGESAVGKDYSFCNNPSLSPSGTTSKFFNFDKYIATYYTYNGATTNYPEVFASATDMAGIQGLIDQHLAAKAYMNYNYTEPEDDEGDDGVMTDADAEESDAE